MWYLVDTNVFLDYLFDRDPFSDDVAKFFIHCSKNEDKLFITPMAFRDIGYIAMKYVHSKEIAEQIQGKVYAMCSKIIDNTGDDAINAFYSEVKDYEDALMVEAAKVNSINAIITNNLKDYKNAKFPVFTPKQIVEFNNKRVVL